MDYRYITTGEFCRDLDNPNGVICVEEIKDKETGEIKLRKIKIEKVETEYVG